jgi:hypothetical protein
VPSRHLTGPEQAHRLDVFVAAGQQAGAGLGVFQAVSVDQKAAADHIAFRRDVAVVDLEAGHGDESDGMVSRSGCEQLSLDPGRLGHQSQELGDKGVADLRLVVVLDDQAGDAVLDLAVVVKASLQRGH